LIKLSALALVAFALGAVTVSAAAAPEVTTIAGSGAAGIADGPAQQATFLFPAGVAVARDGSIYISDLAAQRIRVLTPAGNVRTVAGSGSIAPPGFAVPPGYRDGPALQAQFNGPEGLTVGPDGSLYIADSYNACIRKLQHGFVTTFFGKCGDRGVLDGTRAVARLNRPRDLAFDAAGNLYIADDGVGLRKLSKNGVLTTIRFKQYGDHSSHGVAIAGASDPIVLDATVDGVVAYYPSTGQDEMLGAGISSMPSMVAAVDRRQFLFTDLLSHNVRYFRTPAFPFVGQYSRIIAGQVSERGIDNAGFANGPRADARFYDPMGIAVAGNRAIIADGGNRRIREMLLPHSRVSETGFDAANNTDDRHYEVALVGASWSFWESLGDDSICAQIERTLNASHRFSKPVRCHTITMNGGSSLAMEDYIKNVFPYQRMDLVILDAEPELVGFPNNATPANAAFVSRFRLRMQHLLDVLRPLHTQLAAVWIYPAQLTSDAEWVIDKWPAGGFRTLPDYTADNADHQTSVRLEKTLRDMPILQYDMYYDMVDYQLSRGATMLYHPDDQHPNPRGNAFFGDHFARGLLAAGLGRK
jgi:hypothetical protein